MEEARPTALIVKTGDISHNGLVRFVMMAKERIKTDLYLHVRSPASRRFFLPAKWTIKEKLTDLAFCHLAKLRK